MSRMRDILKPYKLFLIIIFTVGLIFGFIQLTCILSPGYRSNPEVFVEQESIYDSQCYYINKYIYAISPQIGVVQIFADDGEFIKGIYLPTVGGTVWSGSNDKIYLYCVRSNTQVTIDGEEFMCEYNIYYDDLNDFYISKNINNKYMCMLKGNKVYINNGVDMIRLNTRRNYFSVDVSVALLIICFFGLLITTGAFMHLIDEAVSGKK